VRALRTALLAAGSIALAIAPAGADWLVMKDGSTLETKGPWKVDGRRVVFTQPNGTLSAIRAEEVDLDGSAAETARVVEAATKPPAPPPPAPLKEPIMVLTEKDFPPVVEGAPAPSAEGAAAGTETAASASGLQVATWQKVQSGGGDGVEVFGTIRNSGTTSVTSPTIMVMIYSDDGGLLATNDGTVNAAAIPPGGSANFRVAFPGLPDFASARFDVQGRSFQSRPQGEEGEEGEESGDQESPTENSGEGA